MSVQDYVCLHVGVERVVEGVPSKVINTSWAGTLRRERHSCPVSPGQAWEPALTLDRPSQLTKGSFHPGSPTSPANTHSSYQLSTVQASGLPDNSRAELASVEREQRVGQASQSQASAGTLSSCVQVLGGWPGQVLPLHELCIQGLTMIPGTQG